MSKAFDKAVELIDTVNKDNQDEVHTLLRELEKQVDDFEKEPFKDLYESYYMMRT